MATEAEDAAGATAAARPRLLFGGLPADDSAARGPAHAAAHPSAAAHTVPGSRSHALAFPTTVAVAGTSCAALPFPFAGTSRSAGPFTVAGTSRSALAIAGCAPGR